MIRSKRICNTRIRNSRIRHARRPARLLASLAILFPALLGAPFSALAQGLDNIGDEFISVFIRNALSSSTELYLASDTDTMVTIEYPVNAPSFTTTVAVTPGVVTVVNIPATASSAWNPNTVSNNGVRATAPDPFAMYMANRTTFSSDAAMALPVDTFNTEYLLNTYNPRFFGANFGVVAAFDNTTVTITPSNALVGRAAGVPFSVTLNRGEAYYGRSQNTTSAAGDLTGTAISSDRPVGVTNGDGCTQVPTGTIACDHIFEVAQAVQSWGTSTPVTNLPLRANGSIYKILASEDNTEVLQDGVPIGTINAGQFIETPPLTGRHLFTTTGNLPFYVTQYMTGQGAGNSTGDPAMGNMIPSAQYQSAYTFATPPGTQFATHFLTVTAEEADVTGLNMLLDGAPIDPSLFEPIPGTSLMSAIVELSPGSHTTASTSAPHGITVEGFNNFDSYIYPGGALFEFINPPETDPPVCVAQTNAGPPPFATGSVTDDQGTDPSGVFFVDLVPGASNLTLTVDPFVPGDASATFRVDLTDPSQPGTGTVSGRDGAGNECTIDLDLTLVTRCDVDSNGQVDRNDIRAIMARRNQPANGPDDPADANGDGFIDANDARQCAVQCTNSRCAP